MPRRAPEPDQRLRDATRTRWQLLDAALAEFAAKGFAGARVADIAARAGVNKQLISYYFGGKEGLYRELHRWWREREATFAGPDKPLGEVVTGYLDAALTDPCPGRLVLWQGLAGDGAPDTPDEDDLSRMSDRQRRGELDPELDPAAVLLAIRGMVMAPVAMPQIAASLLGVDPETPEFRRRYGALLREIVRRLAPATATREPGTTRPAE